MAIKLVSSDWNGTLSGKAGGTEREIRSLHTMSDMISLYRSEEAFAEANEVFKKQTAGEATMQEAFSKAGELSKGISLRQAIEYTTSKMVYMQGFNEFVDTLHKQDIPLVINSTGYSVTMQAIRAMVGEDKIHGFIGNDLVFEEIKGEIDNNQLGSLVSNYIQNPESASGRYDMIQTVGRVDLGLESEDAKAEKILEYTSEHFPAVKPSEILHMGDTFGDSGGIYGIAQAGGIGVAFNYNAALEDFLKQKIFEDPQLGERIHFIDARGPEAHLGNVLKHIL